MKNIILLGSTGSIGTQTLDIMRQNQDRFRIVGLSCHSKISILEQQIQEFEPEVVGVTSEEAKKILSQKFPKLKILTGEEGLVELACWKNVEMVVNALSGSGGLLPTFAALQAGKTVVLANKESIVMAGEILMREVRKNRGRLIPIDSEMSAIFQILDNRPRRDIEKIILTASGGPFFGKTREDLEHVTVEDALKHPTWRMGPKVTIDSATLMNKALEIIEARWLFDVAPEQIEVVVHPESIVHSMVQFRDGSVFAQMSPTDMRFVIHYALFYPERVPNNFSRLHFGHFSASHSSPTLNFHELSVEQEEIFQGPKLAREALAQGSDATARLNEANETAVQKFLNREIGFLEIYEVIKRIISKTPSEFQYLSYKFFTSRVRP